MVLCLEHRQEHNSNRYSCLNTQLSIFIHIQDLPGQGPVQPAVGDPASAGGLD